MKLYGVDGTILDALMTACGYKKGERCLMLGTADGEAGYSCHVKRMVKRICKSRGAMYTMELVQRA